MKTLNILRSILVLAAPILLSACNESLTGTKTAPNVPVSFRIVGAKGTTLDSTELVQIRSYAGDASNRVRLDSLVRRWQDKEVALQVPLGQPLEFRFDGLNRRNDRLVAFWSALGFDTLRSGDRTANVVALQFTSNDVTPPSMALLATPSSGYQVLSNPKGDTLFVSLPTGLSAGKLSLPASLDSVYLDGKNLTKDSVGWTFPVNRGQDRPLTVVNPNGTSSSWVLAIRSGDIQGPSLLISLDNGATESVKSGETVFTLPYVVDSALTLTIANADAKDALASLTFGKNTLDVGESSWTIPVKVPVAGDLTGIQYVLTGKDSLDNVTSQVVKVTRPHFAGTPILTWISLATGKLMGAQQDTLLLKINGGDSTLTPDFKLNGFTFTTPIFEKVWRKADSSLWRCIISLQDKDSGTVEVNAANVSGKSRHLDTVRISRYDPLTGLPPTLTSLLPGDGAWTRRNYMDFSGRAWDGKGGTATVVVADGSGWSDSTASNSIDSSWSLRVLLTTVGARNFIVTAHDKNDRTAEQSFRRRIQRDTSAPILAWSGMSMHGDTLWTRAPSLPLQAMFKDTAGGKTCSLSVQLKDATKRFPGSAFGVDDLWRDTLDVRGLQGVSEWIATGTDSAGNITSQRIHVLRDTVKPVIAVNTPVLAGVAKFSFSAKKDTLWISGDTSLTVIVNAESGHPRIPLLGLLVDSSGEMNSSAKLQQPLTIRQASGTSSLRRIAIFDTLGNASDTTRLVVIGVAPISSPLVLFGDSKVAAKDTESLPWPKTAHMTCPTGTTLNIGTGVAKDSMIWTTTNLSLSCNGPKIRSNVVKYTWTIQDTASIALSAVPTVDSLLAVAVDENNVPWVFGYYNGYNKIHRFSTDTTEWTTAYNSFTDYSITRVFRAAGFDASNKRYFGFYTSKNTIAWMTANGPWSGMLAQTTTGSYQSDGNAIQGNAVRGNSFFQITNRDDVTSNALTSPYSLTKTYDRSIGAIVSSPKTQFAVTKDSIIGIWKIEGKMGSISLNVGTWNNSPAKEAFNLDVDYQRTAIAGRLSDNTFVITAVTGGKLAVFKYSSININPSKSNLSAATLSGTGIPLSPEFGKNDLWINATGNGVFRVEDDLSKVRSWGLAGVQKSPSLNQWDGAWSIVKTSSGYRLYHFKGSKQ